MVALLPLTDRSCAMQCIETEQENRAKAAPSQGPLPHYACLPGHSGAATSGAMLTFVVDALILLQSWTSYKVLHCARLKHLLH